MPGCSAPRGWVSLRTLSFWKSAARAKQSSRASRLVKSHSSSGRSVVLDTWESKACSVCVATTTAHRCSLPCSHSTLRSCPHSSTALALSRLTCRESTRDRKQHLTAGICESGVMQVLGGVDTSELRGLEQRVEGGGDLRAASRLRPVVILSPHHRPPDPSLGRVAIERDPDVTEEAREPVPVGHDVRGGLADGQRLERGLGPEPG